MDITIYGMGSIGAMVATFLQEGNVAGEHTINLVGRPHILSPIKEKGLIYVPYQAKSEQQWIRTTNFQCYNNISEVPHTDVLVCTMKAHSLNANLETAKEMLKQQKPVVIIMMNGLGLKEMVSRYVPENKIIETIANYPCHLQGNVIENDGGNDVVVAEETDLSTKILSILFSKSHLKLEITKGFKIWQWKKAVMNIGMNGTAALTELTVGQVLERETLGAIIKKLIQETITIANKEGISFNEDLTKFFWMAAGKDPTHYPSMYFDVKAHKPTEIDFMNGYIVRKGKEYGISTPANNAIVDLMKIVENR